MTDQNGIVRLGMSTSRDTDDLLRIVLIVLAVLIVAPMLMMVFAFPMMGMWGGGMMSGSGGFGPGSGFGFWGLGTLLVWLALLFGGGYLIYRGVTRRSGVAEDPAIEELRLAYARGDLSDEEFEERRATLREE